MATKRNSLKVFESYTDVPKFTNDFLKQSYSANNSPTKKCDNVKRNTVSIDNELSTKSMSI